MDSSATLERWFFYQDATSLWKWARLDLCGTVLDHSGAAFATRDICVENARRSGYRGGRPHHEEPSVPALRAVTTTRRANQPRY